MYTQCPECRAAFSVTANDLKQAAGKVRCGGCGRAFDALQFLSEEMPVGEPGAKSGPKLPELKPDVPGKRRPQTISPEDSIALLKTLEQLAGSDIRLEDTGIEWRVLDDQVIAGLETEDEEPIGEANDTEADATRDDEQRYDDDTPLNEEPSKPDPDAAEAESDDERATNEDGVSAAGDEPDVDFDDDEGGEWEEILEEFDDGDVADEDRPAREENAGDPLTETTVEESAEDKDEVPTGDETDKDEGDAEPPDESPDEARGEEHDDTDRGAVDDDTETYAEAAPEVVEEDVAVESIILEGDTVRSALDEEGEETPVELSTFWVLPEGSAPAQRSSGARIGMLFAAVLLLIVLGLQAVHQNRTKLATIPELRNLIAPAYRAVGMPLVPTWDVRGWRFEATQGNTQDDQLIVYSRLGNTSEEPLPFPLIGVSLTDRFEETVGGVLLEPSEYLVGNQNPRDPVAPGNTFDSVITLQSPDPAATGYRLRACYRAARGKLRCAVGDFRQ